MQLYAPIFVDLAFTGRDLHQVMIGLVTACFPLGMMIFSFCIEKIVARTGQRYSFLLSMALALLAAFCYGSVYYIQNPFVFVVVSMVGRLIHGLEDSIFEVICVHYIQHSESLDKDKSFASYKLAGSAGFIMGGVVAPLIYLYFGFFWSFMLYGITVAVLGLYTGYFLPKDIKPKYGSEDDSNSNDAENQGLLTDITSVGTIDDNVLYKSASMKKILKNERMGLTLMGLFLSLCCLMTIIPTLTIMLQSRHNISTEASYYFFVV